MLEGVLCHEQAASCLGQHRALATAITACWEQGSAPAKSPPQHCQRVAQQDLPQSHPRDELCFWLMIMFLASTEGKLCPSLKIHIRP